MKKLLKVEILILEQKKERTHSCKMFQSNTFTDFTSRTFRLFTKQFKINLILSIFNFSKFKLKANFEEAINLRTK